MNPIDCRPEMIQFKNRQIPNSINLFKLFKEFKLTTHSDENRNKGYIIPYIRIYIDSIE